MYHFLLPYSNWETGSVCFSECFESRSRGLQNVMRDLGGVTKAHQTDRLTTAVRATKDPEEFTQGYRGLLRHYGMEPKATQANSPPETRCVRRWKSIPRAADGILRTELRGVCHHVLQAAGGRPLQRFEMRESGQGENVVML